MLEKPELVVQTIYKVLLDSLKMFSTVAPFITEKIYQNLKEAFNLDLESIHFADWPEYDNSKIDELLEREMELVENLIQSGLAAREKIKTGVRWPLQKITIVSKDPEVQRTITALGGILKSKLNIKEIEVTREFKDTKIELLPNKTTIGKDFKQDSPAILSDINQEILEKLKSGEHAFVNKFELTNNHLIIKETMPEGITTNEFKKGYIVLDSNISEELETEGFARELIRRVQDLRKELKLNKTQEIDLAIEGDKNISGFSTVIKERVGAKTLVFEKKDHSEMSEFKIKETFFKLYLRVI